VRPGSKPRGIVGVGRIQGQPIIDQDSAWGRYGRALGADSETEWRAQASAVLSNSRKTYNGQMLAIELVDFQPFPTPVLPDAVGLDDRGWSDKKEAGEDATRRLLALLFSSTGTEQPLPEEVGQTGLIEGAVRTITVNAYERSSKAREQCIAAHGRACFVCGFRFGEMYGPEFAELIHVHHLRPLSEIGGEYQVNPLVDLCPVCPNCHAVIHHGGGLRDIEQVRQFIALQQQLAANAPSNSLA
jgi:predicted HNH restriction endonuclease